ncbi:MAG: hypothetical protein AAGC81_19035, partial [Pseudomonadota bacterium]
VAFYSAPSGSRGFIHPPKWADTAGPYDPDQIITTTLHDYVKSGKHLSNETTGRYTSFSIPRRFLDQTKLVPNDAAFHVDTILEWLPKGSGSQRFKSRLDLQGFEIKPRSDYRIATSLSSLSSGRTTLSVALPRFKRLAKEFAGYTHQNGSVYKSRTQFYLIAEDHCGFDVFEPDFQHDFPPFGGLPLDQDIRSELPPPMNLGRIFGYPSGEDPYDFVIQCTSKGNGRGFCNLKAPFNDYIAAMYTFEPQRICEITEVMDSFESLMTGFVSDQEREVLNR